jgi:MOSC domain-containing protein YiiM
MVGEAGFFNIVQYITMPGRRLPHHSGMAFIVQSVNVDQAREVQIGGRAVMTAIAKRPVSGPVAVRRMGLAGDEQADLSVHGGLGKAAYAYPSEHYPFWQTVRAQARVSLWDETLPPGSMGENLTLAGLLENQVWVGDVLRFADCELAVNEPRFPCFKFNAAMGFSQASKLMEANAWCGFYLAVRMAGTLHPGEAFELVPGPREVGIAELFRARVAGRRR